jgi:hypothetical protein
MAARPLRPGDVHDAEAGTHPARAVGAEGEREPPCFRFCIRKLVKVDRPF